MGGIRRAHVGVLTIVHATVMVTSTTFDSGILEGQTLYPGLHVTWILWTACTAISYRLVHNPISSRELSRTLHEPIRLTAAAAAAKPCFLLQKFLIKSKFYPFSFSGL